MPDKHREFFEQITESGETKPGPTVHHSTASYNPTDRCGYHRPADDYPATLRRKQRQAGSATERFASRFLSAHFIQPPCVAYPTPIFGNHYQLV